MNKYIKSVGADAPVRPSSKARQNKGITLIALVITIIVMLILVAVTINMAVNGGLFSYAGKAVGETQNAINAEQELANGKIQVDGKWYASIDDYLAGKVAILSYDETAKDANGMLTANAIYTDENEETALIPKGFAISSEADEQTIESGLVIKDENENEFVWIPVAKAIVTESEIASIKAEDTSITTDLAAVKKMVANGTYPMAVQVGTDYKGILYNFSGTDVLTLTIRSDWAGTEYREPANLSESYDGTDFLEDWTSSLYQNSYNKMVESVSENGGFYVGRYEISNTDADGNTLTYAQSKKGQTSTTQVTWYEMYNLQKAYAKENSALGVTSEMIWGSQWDQMLIFVNGKYDGAEVPEKFYVAGCSEARIISDEYRGITGVNTNDKVANIFDIENNSGEWSQEAKGNFSRVYRGR